MILISALMLLQAQPAETVRLDLADNGAACSVRADGAAAFSTEEIEANPSASVECFDHVLKRVTEAGPLPRLGFVGNEEYAPEISK